MTATLDDLDHACYWASDMGHPEIGKWPIKRITITRVESDGNEV